MYKFVKTLIFTAAFSMFAVVPAFASPEHAKTGNFSWVTTNNSWVAYNEQGGLATGWIKYHDNIYYLNKSGVMKTGWIKEDNNWYYLKEDSGELITNQWVDNYYLDATGKMANFFMPTKYRPT